ncbi:putative protein with domain-containing protein [Lyophyllum shimeji]|uniref:Uncharacterized protein n=1 Tax=Lyophyllum shimeji TaxID=47721 RepID=A0A9P3PWB0_LYOSH|nr:putative protein with domain-containing protein [Lyophyllum shimeji]
MEIFREAAFRIKNFTQDCTETQGKVRDATCNDHWGPSESQIHEIAQLTYNQNDYTEIVEFLDRRLNEKGKNWRGVFKSLVLLQFCLHHGSPDIFIHFRENAYIVRTLHEFQYVDEDGNDLGANVREKAKEVANLLMDESRLRGKQREQAFMSDRSVRPLLGPTSPVPSSVALDVYGGHTRIPQPDPQLSEENLKIALRERGLLPSPEPNTDDDHSERKGDRNLSGLPPSPDDARVALDGASTPETPLASLNPFRLPMHSEGYHPADFGAMQHAGTNGQPYMPMNPPMDVDMSSQLEMRPPIHTGHPQTMRGRRRGGTFGGEVQGFRPERRNDKTLVVEKIPEDKLTLEQVNGWFKRFGTVTDVAIDSMNAEALISFSNHDETYAAWKSECAVFNNRLQPGQKPQRAAAAERTHREKPAEPADAKVVELAARLGALLKDRGKYNQFLACRDSSAQGLLNMLQRFLDVHEFSPSSSFRRDLIVAIQRLAGNSGLYPVCYELTNVSTEGLPQSSGSFADIYMGRFQGRAVCLKTIRFNKQTDMRHFLKVCSNEAILWGQLSHPNLLPFYGVFRFGGSISMVSPWMVNGDINNYLKNHPSAHRSLLAFDVAQGLRFLHENLVIHGDLKGPNILVNESGKALLADFGISSISDPQILALTSHSVGSKGGSVRWQAPELFDEDIHNTTASDVYAWSCVVYEIYAGHMPFVHVRDQAVVLKVTKGERPGRPSAESGLTDEIWSLMQDCWETTPAKRPTVDQVIEWLMADLPQGTRAAPQQDGVGTLSPAQFREMARKGQTHEEINARGYWTDILASLIPACIFPCYGVSAAKEATQLAPACQVCWHAPGEEWDTEPPMGRCRSCFL